VHSQPGHRRDASRLNARGEEHDTDGSAEGLRRKVVSEAGTNLSSGAVGTRNLAPDGANGRLALGRVLHLVDVGDALSEIAASLGLVVHILELENGAARRLVALGTAVAHVASLHVKSTHSMQTKGREVRCCPLKMFKERSHNGLTRNAWMEWGVEEMERLTYLPAMVMSSWGTPVLATLT
jgi:hypothetical protein